MSEDYVSKEAFAAHAQNEEHNQRVTNDALHEGNIRMGSIESNLNELAADLKPLKALYNAVIGATALGVFTLMLLGYIYTGAQARVEEDRAEIKSLVKSVHSHTVIIEKMVQSHEELERDVTKEFGRIEKQLDKQGKL